MLLAAASASTAFTAMPSLRIAATHRAGVPVLSTGPTLVQADAIPDVLLQTILGFQAEAPRFDLGPSERSDEMGEDALAENALAEDETSTAASVGAFMRGRSLIAVLQDALRRKRSDPDSAERSFT